MFHYPYLVELLSPKKSNDDQFDSLLDRFAERYRRIIVGELDVPQPLSSDLITLTQMDTHPLLSMPF